MTVPKINNTDTDTFFRHQIFSIPIPVLFLVPNFSDTGSETFFRYQIFPITVRRLFPIPNFIATGSETFSGANLFQYRFRYHLKNEKFPVLGIFNFFGGIGTGIRTNWYREKVSEPVSVKFGIGKMSRNRYRKYLVPEKSTGIGIENI